MAEKSIEELREDLRSLGYLTHGIERWFALDPWSSRTFWAELVAVSTKATVLLAFFATLPFVSIMVVRNQPVPLRGVTVLFGLYFVAAAASLFVLIVAIALVLRSRPTMAIDSPAALTGMSLTLASIVTAGIIVWWSGFASAPTALEVAIGGALIILFIVVATLVFSAALLSFSIHEAKRIPLVAQRDRTAPLFIVAVVVMIVIGSWAMRAADSRTVDAPAQVATVPTTTRLALLAVDGMTWDLFAAQRPADLELAFATPLTPLAETHSSAERWATLGTGTQPSAHQVRAIEGIRLAGTTQVLQASSHWDFVVDRLAVPLALAKRIPLPPTERRRHYVWEILGARGVTSAAVNWWVTEDTTTPNITSISQSTVFAAAKQDDETPTTLALAIDHTALARLDAAVAAGHPRFVSAYLPAIDIALNRIDLDPSARAAASTRAASEVFSAARRLKGDGYEIVIVGMPGENAEANAVLASTVEAASPPTLDSIAPTILTVMGFPISEEMSSESFTSIETRSIPTYGDRKISSDRTAASDDYYESLKSLGYIQ